MFFSVSVYGVDPSHTITKFKTESTGGYLVKNLSWNSLKSKLNTLPETNSQTTTENGWFRVSAYVSGAMSMLASGTVHSWDVLSGN